MSIPLLNKYVDRIKQRKQFKDVKDKKKAVLKYINKKYKESEAIVKKQYGSSNDVPAGKYYGTLMIILKNKLHVNEHKYEKLYYQLITEENINFKNTIKIAIFNNYGDLNKEFSAWYVPLNDTFIYFPFAKHTKFMELYFPFINYEDKKLQIMIPNDKTDHIIGHYKNDIGKQLKKDHETKTSYTTLYSLGWVRVNITNDQAAITYNNKADKKNINKCIIYLKQNIKQDFVLKIENIDNKNDYRTIKKSEINDNPTSNNSTDVIDVVRNRKFGLNSYVGPNESKFMKMYRLLNEEHLDEITINKNTYI